MKELEHNEQEEEELVHYDGTEIVLAFLLLTQPFWQPWAHR